MMQISNLRTNEIRPITAPVNLSILAQYEALILSNGDDGSGDMPVC